MPEEMFMMAKEAPGVDHWTSNGSVELLDRHMI